MVPVVKYVRLCLGGVFLWLLKFVTTAFLAALVSRNALLARFLPVTASSLSTQISVFLAAFARMFVRLVPRFKSKFGEIRDTVRASTVAVVSVGARFLGLLPAFIFGQRSHDIHRARRQNLFLSTPGLRTHKPGDRCLAHRHRKRE